MHVSGSHATSAKALVKGLAVVQIISVCGRPTSLKTITDALDMPRTTVQRLLRVLVDQNIIQGDAGAGFALGPQLAVWGARYIDDLDVLQVAKPFLKELADKTRETVYLGVRLGDRVLYLGKESSPQPVQPSAVIGASNPLHSTAIGKALLVWSLETVRADYLQHPLERRTEGTITDAGALALELDKTRSRGYAIDDVENEEGVRCVAAPILGPHGAALAAISVSAPSYRFSRNDITTIAPDVIRVANAVSSGCGGEETIASPASRHPSRRRK